MAHPFLGLRRPLEHNRYSYAGDKDCALADFHPEAGPLVFAVGTELLSGPQLLLLTLRAGCHRDLLAVREA